MLTSKDRFPGQEQSGGASKIPTTIIYNRDGCVMAVGAEAVDLEERCGHALEDNGMAKACWYENFYSVVARH